MSEKTYFTSIINEIIDTAAQYGLDEKNLAVRAGISPETLSRMKKRGDGKFSVVNKMAKIIRMRLSLAPDDNILEALNKGEFFS